MRNGAVWAAMQLSDVHAQLGQLMLVLAPLGFLLPVVAMLSICRRSLPALQEVEALDEVAPTEGRRLRLLDVAVSVMVPFLAVYASYGLLAAGHLPLSQRRSGRRSSPGPHARLGVDQHRRSARDLLGAGRPADRPRRVARALPAGSGRARGSTSPRWPTSALSWRSTTRRSWPAQLVVLRAKGVPWLEDRVAAQWLRDCLRRRRGLRRARSRALPVAGPRSPGPRRLVHAGGGRPGRVVGAGGRRARLPARRTTRPPPRWPPTSTSEAGLPAARSGWTSRSGSPHCSPASGCSRPPGSRRCWSSASCFLLVTRMPFVVHLVMRAVVGPRLFGTWVAINPYEAAFGFALSLMLTAPMLAAARRLAGQDDGQLHVVRCLPPHQHLRDRRGRAAPGSPVRSTRSVAGPRPRGRCPARRWR